MLVVVVVVGEQDTGKR